MPLPNGWHAELSVWNSKRRWHAEPGRCMDCGEILLPGRLFWCSECWEWNQQEAQRWPAGTFNTAPHVRTCP